MTWGFYLIVFWFVFLWTSPNFGAAWEGTSAIGRTATRGSIARAGTKVNGYNPLESFRGRWAGRKSDHFLFLCGFLLAWTQKQLGKFTPTRVPSSPRVISIMLLAPGC